MAIDALAVLQVSVTKTATFNGAGYDLKNGTPNRGLAAVVQYSAATNASGANAFTFSVDHSDDDSTYYALASGASDVVTLSTTAQAAEIYIPFMTNKRYVRLTVTQVGAGSTPTITYIGYLTDGLQG
jgi:hypothetical protein